MSKSDDIALEYVIEEFREFVNLVRQMREQQQIYFKERTKESLYMAIELEKEVNKQIKELEIKLSKKENSEEGTLNEI